MEEVIPKKIWQTWCTKDPEKLPIYMNINVNKIKISNREFEHYLFDDNDCEEFIKQNFSNKIYETFLKLIPGAYKADLWRYCVLYIHGGIYIDIKFKRANSFKFIELIYKEHFVIDREGYWKDNKFGVYNSFMVAKPGNKLLLKCINAIVYNVDTNNYSFNSLYPTGPGLVGELYLSVYKDKDNLDMIATKALEISYKGKIIIKSYPEYRIEQRDTPNYKGYNYYYENKNIYKTSITVKKESSNNSTEDLLKKLISKPTSTKNGNKGNNNTNLDNNGYTNNFNNNTKGDITNENNGNTTKGTNGNTINGNSNNFNNTNNFNNANNGNTISGNNGYTTNGNNGYTTNGNTTTTELRDKKISFDILKKELNFIANEEEYNNLENIKINELLNSITVEKLIDPDNFIIKNLDLDKIPLNIFQTWKEQNMPYEMKKNINNLRSNNMQFNHYIFDNVQCLKFINKFFIKDVGSAFENLIPGAYKADLWRYCILYVFGGIYLDVKFECINNFKLIELTHDEHYTLDLKNENWHKSEQNGIFNGIMVNKPGNTILLMCISEIVKNVKNKFYGDNWLEPTGPLLLGKMFLKYHKENINNEKSTPEYREELIKQDINIKKEEYEKQGELDGQDIIYNERGKCEKQGTEVEKSQNVEQDISEKQESEEHGENEKQKGEEQRENEKQEKSRGQEESSGGSEKQEKSRGQEESSGGSEKQEESSEDNEDREKEKESKKEEPQGKREEMEDNIFSCSKKILEHYKLDISFDPTPPVKFIFIYKGKKILKQYDNYRKDLENYNYISYAKYWENKNIYKNDKIIIPLHIWQTWNTKNLPPLMKKNMEELIKENLEFTHHLSDDEECEEFIRLNFSNDIYESFRNLIPGAYKADLWRYCVLYAHGGIYLDIKYKSMNKFKLINLTYNEHYIMDRLDHFEKGKLGIHQSFLVCCKKNPLMLRCIKQIVLNIKNNYYGYSPLHPTGPGLIGNLYLNSYTDTSKIDMHNIDSIYISYEKKFIFTYYNEYRTEQKNSVKNYKTYEELWKSKLIYKDLFKEEFGEFGEILRNNKIFVINGREELKFMNFFDITEIVNKEGNIIIDYSDEQIINFENNIEFLNPLGIYIFSINPIILEYVTNLLKNMCDKVDEWIKKISVNKKYIFIEF